MVPFQVSVHIIEPTWFRTGMPSVENVQRELWPVWDRLSPELKQEYGADFPEKCKV